MRDKLFPKKNNENKNSISRSWLLEYNTFIHATYIQNAPSKQTECERKVCSNDLWNENVQLFIRYDFVEVYGRQFSYVNDYVFTDDLDVVQSYDVCLCCL